MAPFTFACAIMYGKSSSLLGVAVALISFAYSQYDNRVKWLTRQSHVLVVDTNIIAESS
jgi:hypothetical protein